MCYKDEVQRKNADKLQRKFEEDGVPEFIRTYFVNIDSQAAAINYYVVLKDLFLWLIEKNLIKKNKISDIEPDDFYEAEAENIIQYIKEKRESGIARSTLNTRKNIFRSFWNYLVRTKKCKVKENIIEGVKTKLASSNNNLIKKFPSDEQLKSMEEKINNKKDSFIRARNLCVLNVLKGTGLRESELAGLDIKDIFLDSDMPYVTILGKGDYDKDEYRTVYLTGGSINAIRQWIKVRNTVEIIDNNALFVNKNGKRLNEGNIQTIFKNYSNGITPHMMRHWYATIMARSGNIAFVQQQLGHTSQDTTINNYTNGAYDMKDVLKNMS